MKWILLSSLLFSQNVFAGPPKKAHPDEVKVTESYSVASLGLEAEAYRIQEMRFQGKTSYKAAKLVNGILSTEHEIPVTTFKQMKSMVAPLMKMESNEDCKTPMRFTFRAGKSEDQLKLCMEKSNVSSPVKKFNERAKKVLGLEPGEKVHQEAAPAPEEMEKTEEPLPE